MNYTELVEKAKIKDEKAIEQLFELTSQKGYFVALKYLKNKEDASDILQDAYVAALSKLDQLKDPSRFDKWLFQIIANKAKNYLVKNKPLLFEQLESDDEDAINFEETIHDDRLEFQPRENFDYQELRGAIKALIEELPDDQRMCLLMYYFEDLSINEIADSLELNTNTIKSRLNYARKKIKDKIEELQKKGTHLYSVSPIPFLLWMLLEEEKATAAPKIASTLLQTHIAQSTGQVVAHKGIVVAGKYISTKVIIATTLSAITIFAGGLVYYNYSQKQERQMIYDSLSITFGENISLEYGDTFDDSKVILDHTGELKLVQSIDTKKLGKQTLQYVVSKDDVDRNFEYSIEIKDTQYPIINLSEESINLTVGDSFDPLSYLVEAYDKVDGDLMEKVEIENPVDINKEGIYEVKYKTSDINKLSTEVLMKVVVSPKKVNQANNSIESGEPKPNEAPTIQNVSLGKLGLSMQIPADLTQSDTRMSGDTGFFENGFVSNDTNKYGSEGIAVIVEHFPYTQEFESAQAATYLFKPRSYYIEKDFELIDRGDYFIGYHRGYDGSVMGSAWAMPYIIDAITIHIQGPDRSEYVIIVKTIASDKGIYLGNDGFEDKRVDVARQIFNSIK